MKRVEELVAGLGLGPDIAVVARLRRRVGWLQVDRGAMVGGIACQRPGSRLSDISALGPRGHDEPFEAFDIVSGFLDDRGRVRLGGLERAPTLCLDGQHGMGENPDPKVDPSRLLDVGARIFRSMLGTASALEPDDPELPGRGIGALVDLSWVRHWSGM